MSNDLLPESVNTILDDVETTLCLPILILIVVCTLQFIIYDFVDIGCTLYENIRNFTSSKGNKDCIVNRVKGMIKNCVNYIPGMKNKRKKTPKCRRNIIRRQEEWDLCDEDDDDDDYDC